MDDRLFGFLIGSVLGDGGFVRKTPNHNTYVVFKHSSAQIEYLSWKYEFLKEYGAINSNVKVKLINRENKEYMYKNAKDQYRFATKSLKEFNCFKEMSKKELIENMNEMALSIYILDDGNIYNKICKISCGTLKDEERESFVKMLNNKFDIECRIYHHKTNRSKDYFYIPSSSYKKIKEIILKNIPSSVDVIKNKLGVCN